MDNKFETIIIGGFAGSGSSAVVDLLREFEGVENLEMEFRLLTDPDGIFSLENNLVRNWTPYQSDIAVKRFRKLILALSKKRKSPYYGQDYNKMLSPEFSRLSNAYLESLISFSYVGKWFGIETGAMYYARKINYHVNKILRFIPFNLYTVFYKNIYLAYPEDEFYNKTKEYLAALIKPQQGSTAKYFVIDEGFSSLHPQRILNYFSSAKSIIIHRDPRDIYVNAVKYSFDFIPRDVDSFIKWHRYLQKQTLKVKGDNILRVNFEDLITEYETEINKIMQFLKMSKSDHKNPKQYLKPDESVKNIGLWKDFQDQNAIAKIEKELNEHLYIK